MLRILCIAALVGMVLGDTVVLNQMIDQMLAGLDAELLQNGKATIPVENMDHEWSYKVMHIKLKGHCNCRDGYAKNLASLRRTGDVSMTTEGNRITLNVALGLGELEFGFNACQFKAKRLFSITQHVKASVSSNSIAAQVTVVKNGDQCTVNVDSIGLNNLGSIKINTGGGVLHKIEDKILNWFASHFHGKIQSGINSALDRAAREHIGQADLCHHLPI